MSAQPVSAMDKKMYYFGCSPVNEEQAEKWAREHKADTWIYIPTTQTVLIVARPVNLPEMVVEP